MSSTIGRQPVGDVSPAYVLAVNRRTPRFSWSVGRQQAEPLGRSVRVPQWGRLRSCRGPRAAPDTGPDSLPLRRTPSPRTKARIAAPTGAPLTAGPYPAGPARRSAAETPPAHCTDDTRRWAAVAESI